MSRLADVLPTQRQDDYRYYHRSRINQTLHLIGAVIFLVSYGLLFQDPALAGLTGWLAMLTQQTSHFFFEPSGYDAVNQTSALQAKAGSPALTARRARYYGIREELFEVTVTTHFEGRAKPVPNHAPFAQL